MNHILVVDDEAEIRTSLEEILREEGYGVAGAATAAEALVLLQDAPYDVVLLDIWLPDRDGLEVLCRYALAGSRDQAGSRHHQRPRHHRDRRQSHQARRLRLPREAALPRPHPDRPQERRRSAPPAHREPGVQAPVQRRARSSPAKACPSRPCASRFVSWRPPTAACSSTANRAPARN